MKRPSLTQILLQSVSVRALELGVSLQLASSKSSQPGELVVAGLLGRIRFWLHLLFVGMGIRQNSDVTSVYRLSDEPRNRHFSRLRRRETPLAHRTYALGHILLRRWGYAHFLSWYARFTLIGPMRRSIRWGVNLFYVARKLAVSTFQALGPKKPLSAISGLKLCAAPLSPD